jgi:hypothetical protein
MRLKLDREARGGPLHQHVVDEKHVHATRSISPASFYLRRVVTGVAPPVVSFGRLPAG